MSDDDGADEIALEACDYDRKYLLVSVPDFDVDPVEGDGTRRMTSYLRLGTVPDDWKSLPGAELELAVHADYGIGGGRGDDRPIGQVVPGEVLPSDPIDPRYVAPTVDSLTDRFAAEVQAAVDASAELAAVIAWAEAEQALVTSKRSVTAPDPSQVAVVVGQEASTYPETVTPADFVRFVLVDCESSAASIEQRLAGLSLGGPTAPLSDREAGDVAERMGLRQLADEVLRAVPAADVPWKALAVTPFHAALSAVRADAAARAQASVIEAVTDYPDMLLPSGEPKYPPYVDDLRYRGESGDETNYNEPDVRALHSRHLHTRGGWRDHSDGNRITTTYGDKVEVIRGNYKLMVLGRQSDPSSSNLVDYSGQITQSDDNMLLRVEYTRKDDMWNWETVNENVIQSEKVSGKTYSWWYGVEQIEIVGSDSPTKTTPENPMGLDGDGKCRANPNLTSRTWARAVKEYAGSAKLPIESTYSETWIDEGEEKTTVTRGTRATTTIGGGTIETTAIGGGTVETTAIGGGTVATTTIGGAAISVDVVGGAKVGITGVGGAIVDVTGSIAKVEAKVHLVHVELTAVAVHAGLKAIGIEIDLSATGLTIKGEISGPTIKLNKEKTETATTVSETCTQYTRTSSSDKLNYMTSSETGASKTLTLTDLRIVASSISLG